MGDSPKAKARRRGPGENATKAGHTFHWGAPVIGKEASSLGPGEDARICSCMPWPQAAVCNLSIHDQHYSISPDCQITEEIQGRSGAATGVIFYAIVFIFEYR
jgi:hypothetical protein